MYVSVGRKNAIYGPVLLLFDAGRLAIFGNHLLLASDRQNPAF